MEESRPTGFRIMNIELLQDALGRITILSILGRLVRYVSLYWKNSHVFSSLVTLIYLTTSTYLKHTNIVSLLANHRWYLLGPLDCVGCCLLSRGRVERKGEQILQSLWQSVDSISGVFSYVSPYSYKGTVISI